MFYHKNVPKNAYMASKGMYIFQIILKTSIKKNNNLKFI